MSFSNPEGEVVIKVPRRDPVDSKHLLLSSFGLPQRILKEYSKKNIESLFSWQYDCFSEKGVLEGNSLVISAPTSAGKMLIAEVTAIKTVLESKKQSKMKRVLIIMPYVSAVQEAEAHLRSLFRLVEPPVSIGAFTGNRSYKGNLHDKDIAICTIEKGYALLMEEEEDYDLGLVIVDELHMIGESRGEILELLLTKILYEDKVKKSDQLKKSIQIIGMSATLSNYEMLAEWLRAEHFITNDRSIELKEMIRTGSELLDKNLDPISPKFEIHNDFMEDICCDQIKKNQSVLIFCSTKPLCEQEACTLANKLSVKENLDVYFLEKACEKRRELSELCNETLEKEIIPKGIGYHHAGLSFKSRKIIEDAFRKGHLKVLVATTTLSMGVNLPAHLVIVKSPLNYDDKRWGTSTYKQMIGRAGRKGLVDVGESILMCTESEENEGELLLRSKPEPVKSRFCSPLSIAHRKVLPLRRGLLDIIHKGAIYDRDFSSYFSSSFYYFKENDRTRKFVCAHEKDEAIHFLLDNGFIKLISIKEEESTKERKFSSLPLGLAVQSSGLYPEIAMIAAQAVETINNLNDTDIFFGMYLVALMYQLKSFSPIKPKYQDINSLVPQDIDLKIKMLHDENNSIIVSLMLYEIFELKTSLEGISKKYDVSEIDLKNLLDEIMIYAKMMSSLSHKINEAGNSINHLMKFIQCISDHKKLNNAVKQEGLKRDRHEDLADMLLPSKRKMSDKTQENKENIEAAPRMSQLISLKSDTAGEVRILDEAVGEWKTIGTLLDFDDCGSRIDAIGESMKPENAILEIFKLWRQGKARQYQPVTWETLIELLVDCGLKSLAVKVRNAFKSNS